MRQAKEEIRPKTAGVHLAPQIAPRGGHDTHVDGLVRLRADAFDGALGDGAKQLGLHLFGQLAQLVEEQRAAVGLGERAGAATDCAGERALLVAEQQTLGEGRR